MGMAAPMAAGHGYPVAGGERGKTRAADADRDRVAGILSTAYSEGRLSKDEYDARLESALSARTYADLDPLVTDLPAAQVTALSPAAGTAMVTPVTKTNGFAIASLACGLAHSWSGLRRPSRRSCSATWPGARSSAPENRGPAWRLRA